MARTPEELVKHLNEQLGFIESSCDRYDMGHHAEAKRIASALTTLLDGINEQSILSQLGDREKIAFRTFINTTYTKEVIAESGFRLCSICMQVERTIEQARVEISYAPKLHHEAPWYNASFNDWWENEIILKTRENITYSRRELCRFLRDREGGAHLDKNISSNQRELINGKAIGMVFIDPNGKHTDIIIGPHLASVRHIAFECIESLRNYYSQKMSNICTEVA